MRTRSTWAEGRTALRRASEYYFSKHARDLTLPEAALLAALPKGPEYYSPVRYPERALRRRNLVLQEMLNDHKITQQQADAAKAAPLGLHLEAPPNSEAPYFVEEVRRQLESEYGVDEVHGAGLRVYTTLDLNLQRAADQGRAGWHGSLRAAAWMEGPSAECAAGRDADWTTYKHPDWTQPLTDEWLLPRAGDEVSPARMTVKLGDGERDADAGGLGVDAASRRRTDLAQVGDMVYVKVVSGAERRRRRT